MAKVARNKGSYRKRPNGSYQVRFSLGWSEEEKRYISYFEEASSKEEAISVIKDVNDWLYHGGTLAGIPQWRKGTIEESRSASITVTEFISDYLDLKSKQKRVEERTVQSDRQCLNRVIPYFGHKPISEINAHDIDDAFASMRSDGRKNLNGKTYSGTTLQRTYAVLKMLFDKAIDYGYIETNPCSKVEKPKNDTPEKIALSASQAHDLFSTILKEPLSPETVGVALCLSCGLRLSEMLALQWKDYERGQLTIRKSLVHEKQQFKSTKNNETRSIPVVPSVCTMLSSWKKQQKEWYRSNDLKWTNESPIVNSPTGRFTSQSNFSNWFSSQRRHYKLPESFTTHGLRHTFVSLLSRDCGTDNRTAQSLSGHKSSQAFEIYTHTNSESQGKAITQLGLLLSPDGDTRRCKNCRLWTESPIDPTQGACWSTSDNPVAIEAVSDCATGNFELRKYAV